MFILVTLGLLLTTPFSFAVGDRSAGDVEFLYESVNGAGISFATNAADTIKLGMSVGQSGFIYVGTNTDVEAQNGFWKSEGSCVLYQPALVDKQVGTNAVALTFSVVNSNTYRVLSVTHEQGGPTAGSHSYTTVVATILGEGLAGATTTIWHDVSSSTNVGQFYLIQCQE